MEPKLGADLSGVRVSAGSEAATAAEAIGARAFTVGTDVHFGAGQYAPGTKEGDRLLAHELTHAVQAQKSNAVQRKAEEVSNEGEQAGATGSEQATEGVEAAPEAALEVSHPDEPAEKEADRVADGVADALHGDEKQDGENADGKAPKATGKEKGRSKKGPDGETDTATEKHGADGEADDQAAEAAPQEEAQEGAGQPESPEKQPEEKPAPILAKLDPAATRVFRSVASPPSPPPGLAPGADAAAPGSTSTTTPADPYTAFCATLPGDLKDRAASIADPEQRAALQQVGLGGARAFLALSQKATRVELATLPWQAQNTLTAMALNPDEIAIYEGLEPAKRAAWRDELTVDERRDAKGLPSAALQKLLIDPAERQTWRVLRVKAVLPKEIANQLVAAGENPDQIVSALSAGKGGDRLRRVLMDPQLSPGTKTNFITDVKAKLSTCPDPFEAMRQVQPKYKLLGNDASKDGKFATMEILKAMPIVNFPKYGTVPDDKVVEAVAEHAKADDPDVPRLPTKEVDRSGLVVKIKSDKELKKSFAVRYFPQFGRQSASNLKGCDTTIIGGIINKEMLPAYWSYDDKAQMVIGKPADAVAKAFAVDENSDYQTGGVIVALPPEIKAKFAAQNGIKRPTAIDGLAFDQFQIVEDPVQCFGITSGGVGEVVVAPVKFSQTVVKQTF